jgi:hypothetical protein
MASIVVAAMEQRPKDKKFNIIGREDIFYIDIIRSIKKAKGLHTLILTIPIQLFKFLMDMYAFFFKNPPFTSQQLKALTAGDYFNSDPWWDIFDVKSTSFKQAILETFADSEMSKIVLKP